MMGILGDWWQENHGFKFGQRPTVNESLDLPLKQRDYWYPQVSSWEYKQNSIPWDERVTLEVFPEGFVMIWFLLPIGFIVGIIAGFGFQLPLERALLVGTDAAGLVVVIFFLWLLIFQFKQWKKNFRIAWEDNPLWIYSIVALGVFLFSMPFWNW